MIRRYLLIIFGRYLYCLALRLTAYGLYVSSQISTMRLNYTDRNRKIIIGSRKGIDIMSQSVCSK